MEIKTMEDIKELVYKWVKDTQFTGVYRPPNIDFIIEKTNMVEQYLDFIFKSVKQPFIAPMKRGSMGVFLVTDHGLHILVKEFKKKEIEENRNCYLDLEKKINSIMGTDPLTDSEEIV